MRLSLRDLDTGLFLASNGWTSDCRTAQTFTTTDEVSKKASEYNVRNAAAAIIHGDPSRATGFLWVTNPN